MDHRDQISAFATDLDRLIDRYLDEFDLTYAALIGVLTLKQQQLCAACNRSDDDDDEPKISLEP
jgi:hypothetical protein